MNSKESRKRSRKKNKKGGRAAGILAVLLLLILAAAGGAVYYLKFMPTDERQTLESYYEPTEEDELLIILNQEYMPAEESGPNGVVRDGAAYIRLGFLKDYIDDRYVYDGNSGTLRYTTYSATTTAHRDSADYDVAGESAGIAEPVVIETYDEAYVALDFISIYSDITCTYAESPYRLTVFTAGFETEQATVKGDTQLRRFGGPKSKILADVKKGDTVTVIENYGSWSKVLSQDGVIGCIKNTKLKNKTDYVVPATLEAEEQQHNLMEDKICLAWHQSLSPAANEQIEELLASAGSVNVVCPTWFYVDGNDGSIWNNCSYTYVDYCHNRGIKVWGLVNNIENGNVDSTQFLGNVSARDNLVKNLIDQAVAYNLDGINVDFESLPVEAGDAYVQFIRELSLACREKGLILSVDNYPPQSFNMFYNRTEEAAYADYVIVMAYDEHFGGDDEAGPVASLDFVEEAVTATLEEVPADQLILAMPFYMRDWTLASDGSLSSKVLTMENVNSYIAENGITTTWDETEGLNYGEFGSSEKHMIWFEDADSLEKKLDVMDEYGTAGGAFWKLGQEPASIWSLIEKYF